MSEAVLTNRVIESEIKEVFASYPELEYGNSTLANDNRVLVVRFNVKPEFSFNTAAQGKVLTNWIGEKVGEYEQVRIGRTSNGFAIKYITEEVAEYELTD